MTRWKMRKHLSRFEHRISYLRDRIAGGRCTKAGLNHTRAELAALTWALPILQDHVDEMARAEFDAVGRPVASHAERDGASA